MWYGYYRRTVLDPIKNEQKVDTVHLQRRDSAMGQEQEKPRLGAPAERAGGRLVALEAGMSGRFARRVHLSRRKGRVYGHRQLPKARSA